MAACVPGVKPVMQHGPDASTGVVGCEMIAPRHTEALETEFSLFPGCQSVKVKLSCIRHMVFVLDNYDSFTYNLVQYLGELGATVEVRRNDQLTVDEVEKLRPERILVSPGPCTPQEAGISVDLIRHFAGKVPLLGVCLGHQAIGAAFGGKVVRAKNLMHGKTSEVAHDGRSIFQGLTSPMTATRYHSLIVQESDLPEELEVSAWTNEKDGSRTIMGLRHRKFPIEGVQFHPESVLTLEGKKLIRNFLFSGQ
jgi:anthranilate synthase/aminodeoxychorismate synthase-like glutamine amidotransferase